MIAKSKYRKVECLSGNMFWHTRNAFWGGTGQRCGHVIRLNALNLGLSVELLKASGRYESFDKNIGVYRGMIFYMRNAQRNTNSSFEL